MTFPRGTTAALAAIAVALLVAGLYGPVKRAWDGRAKAEAGAALKARVDEERRSRSAEFSADRAQILARIRAQLDSKDFAAAMNAAARYAAVNDTELRALYVQAARAESARQRFDKYRSAVERDCNEPAAREVFARLLNEVPDTAGGPAPLQNDALRFARLTGAAARDPVQARVRAAPQPESHPPSHAPWIERARADHQARLIPDYTAGLTSEGAEAIICVWRIQGVRRGAPANVPFTLDLWLSAAPDGKGFIAEPLAYAERP
jgi:hypothetical protein